MKVLGYGIAIIGVLILFKNALIVGGIFFVIGGFIAGELKVGVRGLGFSMLVLSTAYGYHNGYSAEVFFVMLVGFVMASFNRRRTNDRDNGDTGWGFDIDFSSFGDSDSGGDGGGD